MWGWDEITGGKGLGGYGTGAEETSDGRRNMTTEEASGLGWAEAGQARRAGDRGLLL